MTENRGAQAVHNLYTGCTPTGCTWSAILKRISFALSALAFTVVTFGPVAAGAIMANAKDFVQTFENVCGEQVETKRISNKSHLDSANEEQRSAVQKALRLVSSPEAVWVPDSTLFFQFQKKISEPQICEFASFEFSREHMRAAWVFQIGSGGNWRSEGVPYTRNLTSENGSEVFLLSSGYLARPSEDGFLVMFLTALEIEGRTLTHLVYSRTVESPAGCELWPEECG